MKVIIDLDDLTVTVDPPVEGSEAIAEVYMHISQMLMEATAGASEDNPVDLRIEIKRGDEYEETP